MKPELLMVTNENNLINSLLFVLFKSFQGLVRKLNNPREYADPKYRVRKKVGDGRVQDPTLTESFSNDDERAARIYAGASLLHHANALKMNLKMKLIIIAATQQE